MGPSGSSPTPGPQPPAPVFRGSAFVSGGDAWGSLASLPRRIKCARSPVHEVAVRVSGKGLRGCGRRELTKPLKPQRPLLQCLSLRRWSLQNGGHSL